MEANYAAARSAPWSSEDRKPAFREEQQRRLVRCCPMHKPRWKYSVRFRHGTCRAGYITLILQDGLCTFIRGSCTEAQQSSEILPGDLYAARQSICSGRTLGDASRALRVLRGRPLGASRVLWERRVSWPRWLLRARLLRRRPGCRRRHRCRCVDPRNASACDPKWRRWSKPWRLARLRPPRLRPLALPIRPASIPRIRSAVRASAAAGL